MTLYILSGFAHALEFGVEVPQDMVERAWKYAGSDTSATSTRLLHGAQGDCCWEFVTFLNYVLSLLPRRGLVLAAPSTPRAEELLDFSFQHWKQHSPYLKG